MLFSAFYPFSDHRCLLDGGFTPLARPSWPDPDPDRDYLRGFGGVRRRHKPGFESWVGESRIAIGGPAIKLRLPFTTKTTGTRLRLIRKACYFDGLCNGRFELLFSFEPGGMSRADLPRLIEELLAVEAGVADLDFHGPLRELGVVIAPLWARATVRPDAPHLLQHVRSGRPVCFIEDDRPVPQAVDAAADATTELLVEHRPKAVETFLICNRATGTPAGSRGTEFRARARYMRTYTFRLLQNVESLALLFGSKADIYDDDRLQDALNVYTRQVNRSRQRLEQFPLGELIAYCYAAFERLQPGRVDGLAAKLSRSAMRLNVRRKGLELLARSQEAIIVAGDMVMGDKYEDIKAEGQGIAIGREAKASVSDSVNAPRSQDLAGALKQLADLVRAEKGRDDADTEAVIVDAAAKKAESGDEKGAASLLKKSAKWVTDLAGSVAGSVLSGFINAQLGLK